MHLYIIGAIVIFGFGICIGLLIAAIEVHIGTKKEIRRAGRRPSSPDFVPTIKTIFGDPNKYKS